MVRIKTNIRRAFPVGLSLLVAGASFSCYRKSDPTVGKEMRDAYTAVSKLYGYVWDPVLFNDPKSEDEILGLLKELNRDFHRIKKKTPESMQEPGYNIALAVQQQYLEDIQKRFSEGNKDYAKWRLRSLSQNCIACHSRMSAPVNFLGAPPISAESGFDAQFASAQFLFATRQFDEASEALLDLAKKMAAVPTSRADAFRSLQLWLAIEVRVKNRYRQAAEELTRFQSEFVLTDEDRKSVDAWIIELNQLETINIAGSDPVDLAQELLTPLRGDLSLSKDNANLVNSLLASSLLHNFLLGKDTPVTLSEKDAKRLGRATYLLALSYSHMPIQTFEGFAKLYLEECIREYPGTPEARDAFQLYTEIDELEYGGSGGVHLDEGQREKEAELKSLAMQGSKK